MANTGSMIPAAVLNALVTAAMELNEPGELNQEYARGQANLIVDACGLVQDLHYDLVFAVITHQIRRRDFDAKIRSMP